MNPNDRSEHVPGLGFWCDCDACLSRHEELANAAAALPTPSRARISDPAQVVDIAEARRRAMPKIDAPAVRVFEGDRELNWAEVVARSRGQLPSPPPPKHLGAVAFWLGSTAAVILIWLAVR